MNSIEDIKRLKKELEEINSKKSDAVKNQKYEEAVVLRESEIQKKCEIDSFLDKNDLDVDDEMFIIMKRQFMKIIFFIEDEDTNLTPALIRKLISDIKKKDSEISDLKDKMRKIIDN